ncbi:sulfotransferase family 2 domain-containing protein [Sagittula stellata]|uniref:sulfotransferase family 2 domain-containing protein n=1 Tax=Sagittula stellata TaxID=52603 RepID=UPI00321B2A96
MTAATGFPEEGTAEAPGPDPSPDPLPRSPLPPDAVAAYEVILGRPPNPRTAPPFTSLHQLYRMLFASEEFRQGSRARKTPLGWPMAQVFVSAPARMLFCPIGKNACTLLKSAMVRSAGLPHADWMARDIHTLTDRVRTGAQLSDYTREEAEAMIRDPDILKVAVLRDPERRLLSAYMEKFVIGRTVPANIFHTRTVVEAVQAQAGPEASDFDRGITFRQFIDHVTSVPGRTLDPHWRPQALYLEGIDYDRLYRLDQISVLLALVEERCGIPLDRQARNVTGSGSGGQEGAAMDLWPRDLMIGAKLSHGSFFDAGMRSKVESAFACDYALLEKTFR